MATETIDTVGDLFSSDELSYGTLALETTVTGYINGSYEDSSGYFWYDFGDVWSIDLEKDKEYQITVEELGPLDEFGRNDPLEYDIYIVDPDDTFDGASQYSGGHGTSYSEPVDVLDLTAPETNTFLIRLHEPFSYYPDPIQYQLTVSEVGVVEPPVTELPELVAPDPDSLETALYTGDRFESLTVNYWFAAAGQEESVGWTAAEKAAAQAAMATWSSVANINFVEVADKNDASWWLNMKDDTGRGIPSGSFNFPEPGLVQIGRFYHNTAGWQSEGGNSGTNPGGAAFSTFIHEFGHGLGLAHPHDTEGGSAMLPGVVQEPRDDGFTGGTVGNFANNQGAFTVMSYNRGFASDFGEEREFSYFWGDNITPGAIDIAVVQRLYGARDANTGDTVYTLPSAEQGGTGYSTIWDTSGDDMIQHTGPGKARIDLRAATLTDKPGGGGWVSEVENISGGLTIAAGVEIEKARGGALQDTLTGNDFNNRLEGREKGDLLIGNEGRDKLKGGHGRDTLVGGRGNDSLYGGAERDTATYAESKKAIILDLSTGRAIGEGEDELTSIEIVIGSAKRDELVGSSADEELSGGDEGDRLDGAGGDDVLRGGQGQDTLLGGNDDDVLIGGYNNDSIDGGTGQDTLKFEDAIRGVIVKLNENISKEQGTDTITNIEHVSGTDMDDKIKGNDLANELRGEGGNDDLIGFGGADTLTGGGGRDRMKGGTEGDTFVFEKTSDSGTRNGERDQIKDFGAGDRIDLRGIDAIGGGGDDVFTFLGTGSFTGSGGELRLRVSNGKTFVEGDRNGDNRADFSIMVQGDTPDAGDFLL